MHFTVNGLWIGQPLKLVQIATINSFLRAGYTFQLWCYNTDISVPSGTIVRDANEILPKSDIFYYPENGPIDLAFGRGSIAGFSDIFRYKLLYEHGGWWSDMDITCLKAYTPEEDTYVFRTHGTLPVVGNIMKCPPKSELMRICYERARTEVTALNDDWHKPIKILCETIFKLNLQHYIKESICNLDFDEQIAQYLTTAKEWPNEWYFVHWLNHLSKKWVVKNSRLDLFLKSLGCTPILETENGYLFN